MKIIRSLVLSFLLLGLLCCPACGQATSPPADESISEPSATSAPDGNQADAGQTPEPPETGQPDAEQATIPLEQAAPPLRQGEIIFAPRVSIQEIVDQLGDFATYETGYEVGNSSSYVTLHYPQVIIELIDTEGQLSFPENDDDFLEYDMRKVSLTEADWQVPLRVEYIRWSDPQLIGPRGTAIGATLAEVQACFLDYSALYREQEVDWPLNQTGEKGGFGGFLSAPGYYLYLPVDVYQDTLPKNLYSIPSFGRYQEWNGGLGLSQADIEADYVLMYYAVSDDLQAEFYSENEYDVLDWYWAWYEYTRYFFKDGVVIAIDQGTAPNVP